MPGYRELKPEELAWRLDESLLAFNTTDDVKPLEGTLGQERALRALDFGLGIADSGYNLYVMGQPGTGKMTTVMKTVEKKAAADIGPSDWLYVMDFKSPDRPVCIDLPAGKGCELEADMESLLDQLKKTVPKVFEGEEFEKKRQDAFEAHTARMNEHFDELTKEARARKFSLERTPAGFTLVPLREDGGLMTQTEFEELDQKAKETVQAVGNELQVKLNELVRRAKDLEKEFHERLKDLSREFGMLAVGHLIDDLANKYKEFPKLKTYFDEFKEDVLDRLDDFKAQAAQGPALPFMPKQEPSFERYKVNLLVDHCHCAGAPVVYEPNPTYPNLFGRMEQKLQYGMAVTDFTMIKAGALHRANGGYLVLNVLDLLRNPFAYEGLKRAIKTKTAVIEDVLEQYRMVSIAVLKPEPMPLSVKIILIGSPAIYYLLNQMDDEYRKLFKVHVDFDSRMERTAGSVDAYAAFIATHCKKEGLLAFSRSGVSRMVEYSARLVSDKGKLSSRFVDVADMAREASYWASQAGAAMVERGHVDKAIEEKVYRSNMYEEKIRQAISEGIIMVDVEGDMAGQVNGLSVLSLGGYSFGRPSRITARTFMGRAGMVNIEREVKMSGPIHDKGVMILTGYLGDKFAQDKPLSLSASIAFEQSYEGIEGDSASSTELYALLSSLSGLPIRQGIAVTGSVNQRGLVQPIGGVNEKVEGYFEVCKALGLSGGQGVMVPESNVRHLMLKDEVVDAVKGGKFRLWAISDIDGGIEVLTGVPAGTRQADGSYPEGSVNRLVNDRLAALAKGIKEFGEKKPAEKAGEKEEA